VIVVAAQDDAGVRPRPTPANPPVSVITAAEPSYDEQLRARRKRYLIMMSMRVPFLIAAAALYHIPWLALTIIAISIPLPWCAVLIANDRPPRKARPAVAAVVNHERALPAGGREIVDADAPDDGAEQHRSA
jgi:hypothetical protein